MVMNVGELTTNQGIDICIFDQQLDQKMLNQVFSFFTRPMTCFLSDDQRQQLNQCIDFFFKRIFPICLSIFQLNELNIIDNQDIQNNLCLIGQHLIIQYDRQQLMLRKQHAFLHKKRIKTDLAKDKAPLIFYFCQKYVKKSSKKSLPFAVDEQKKSIKGSKATLFSRSSLILNEQLIKQVSNGKHALSNFQILKRNINYLESEESEATTKKNSLQVASHKSLAGSRAHHHYQNLAFNEKYQKVIRSLTRRQSTSNQPEDKNRSTMCNFRPEFVVTQAKLYLPKDKNNDPPNNSYFNKLDHSVAARKYYGPKLSLKNTHSLFKKRDKPKIVGVKIQNSRKNITAPTEAVHDVLPISQL